MKECDESDIINWGNDKGIIQAGNKERQCLKMASEAGEVCDAVAKQDIEGVIDGIGDTGVTLILLAHMHGVTFQQCLDHAYQTIATRTGRTVDGVFIKDES